MGVLILLCTIHGPMMEHKIMWHEHSSLTKSRPLGGMVTLCVLVATSGCVSNDMPSAYKVPITELDDAAQQNCGAVRGAYAYQGSVIAGNFIGRKPNISNLVAAAFPSRETKPKYFLLNTEWLEENRYNVRIRIYGTDAEQDNALLLEQERVAWCHDAGLRIIDETHGATDGSPYESWEVIDLRNGELSLIVDVTAYTRVAMSFLGSAEPEFVSAEFEEREHP